MTSKDEPRWVHELSPEEAGLVVSQVSALTGSGFPLGPGLLATAEELPRGRVRFTLLRMGRAIEGGSSLEDAVGAEGGRLPGHLRGLVLIGTRSGKTTEVLGRFLAYTNLGADLHGRLWLRLAYPALSLVIAVALVAYMLAILSSFNSVFRDFGIPLPWVTEVLLGVSKYFRLDWALGVEMVLGIVIVLIGIRLMLSQKISRSLLARLPLIGGVWRNSALAEFCHLLALLLESDLPLDEALRLTGTGVNDATIDRMCQAMASEVAGGLSLSQALSRRPIFPVGLARVLYWAEGHQSLPESLHTTGEMFEAQARVQATFAGAILGMIPILLLIGTVLLAVVAIFIPLINLINRLAG